MFLGHKEHHLIVESYHSGEGYKKKKKGQAIRYMEHREDSHPQVVKYGTTVYHCQEFTRIQREKPEPKPES